MRNHKFIRILAICLVAACLFGTVAALSFDKDGNGKTDVWDLQLLANEGASAADGAAALKEAMNGKSSELQPNADGVYEIWSVMGMYNMAAKAKSGASFKLMADVDMCGVVWTPVENFLGHLDGAGHTISNFKMVESKRQNLGLFADTVNFEDGTQSTISNLNLENVQISVFGREDARYIGTLVGTNRAKISNCTAVALVSDQRTKLENTVYIGAIAGRNANHTGENGKQTALGTISGTNALTVSSSLTQQSQFVDTQKVNSKMALSLAELEEGSASRRVGIAGNTRTDGIDTSLLWQDISNSTELVATQVQQVRETVANTMYDMCTVAWTPSQTMKYYRYDGRTEFNTPEDTYYAGYIWLNNVKYEGGYYRGLPYNHGSSGMDRFLSMMELKNGIYTTKAELPTEAYYINLTKILDEINAAYKAGKTKTESGYTVPATMTSAFPNATSQEGFNMYIGTDCSSQASWAWRSAIANSGSGFANLQGTAEMFPTAANLKAYGYWAVNDLVFETITTDLDDKGGVNSSGDKALLTLSVFEADKNAFWQTLAMTSKGDCLMHYSENGGHTRVAIGDAVVIYQFDSATGSSKLDINKSYIVTAEQGGSGHANYNGTDENGKRWRSSCCVDRKATFAELTSNTAYPWFPITCEALRVADSAATTVVCNYANGKVTSNFHIVSTTVNGETVYTGISQTGHRAAFNSITLAAVHKGIAAGDTVQVKLANGETYTFTY